MQLQLTGIGRCLENKMKKTIFIGFNKTATTSIHFTMRKNGFNSVHRAGAWRFKTRYNRLKNVINRRDVITDWGDTHIPLHIIEKLSNDYENELFVLNTRRLSAWIESRFKHYVTRGGWDFDKPTFSVSNSYD